MLHDTCYMLYDTHHKVSNPITTNPIIINIIE